MKKVTQFKFESIEDRLEHEYWEFCLFNHPDTKMNKWGVYKREWTSKQLNTNVYALVCPKCYSGLVMVQPNEIDDNFEATCPRCHRTLSGIFEWPDKDTKEKIQKRIKNKWRTKSYE